MTSLTKNFMAAGYLATGCEGLALSLSAAAAARASGAPLPGAPVFPSMTDPRDPKAKKQVPVIAFYGPGFDDLPDQLCQHTEFGNFWPVPEDVTFTHRKLARKGKKPQPLSFSNTETAFQAMKFFHDEKSLNQFTGLSGGQAFAKKKELVNTPGAAHEDKTAMGIGNWNAMYMLLKVKFGANLDVATKAQKKLRKKLLDTGDKFLIEYNAASGRDNVWSNNGADQADGFNWLGLQLMLLRDEINEGKNGATKASKPDKNAGKWTTYFKGMGMPTTDGTLHLPEGGWDGDWRNQWKDGDFAKYLQLLVEAPTKAVEAELMKRGMVCATPGCGKPSWNGLPGECCSKRCRDGAAVPTCDNPGCKKPTWNGQAGYYCGRWCQTQASAKPKASPAAAGYPAAAAGAPCAGGCGKTSWNGQPTEYCSKSCRQAKLAPAPAAGAPCTRPGCTKPSWNGKAKEYCGKFCRDS